MKRDFTFKVYRELLKSITDTNYSILSYQEYLRKPIQKFVILRHDVDQKPKNALQMALLENEFNIKSSYYFRTVEDSFNEEIIKKIILAGHEIGYHYEDLTLARGDLKLAKDSFEKNLTKLRRFYPVKTICMHGSPFSKWNNKSIWNYINYKDYEIQAEPYYDLDFHQILYLTDTGRKWNKKGVNVRDKVETKYTYNFSTTHDIIDSFYRDHLPAQLMINTHPQRWNDAILPWLEEYISQSTKNIIKSIIVKAALRS